MTGDPAKQVQATRAAVGLCDLSDRGKLRLSGRDRLPWLQGQITNDVLTLPEGRGMEAAVLNVQGHLLTLMRVFALPDALLLDLPAPTKERILATFDRYLILEEVVIEDVTRSLALFSLQGPRAAEALAALVGSAPALPPWGIMEAAWGGAQLLVARTTHTGEDGYDLFVPAALAPSLKEALGASIAPLGGTAVDPEALDLLRLEAGIPWWGRELEEAVVPPEARLDRAISRTKGCYVGQEIIARIDARGQVNTLLVGLAARDRAPRPGDLLFALRDRSRSLGRVTSAGVSPTLYAPIALGYLRREHTEPGTPVIASGEAGEVEVRVRELPFVPWRFPETVGVGER